MKLSAARVIFLPLDCLDEVVAVHMSAFHGYLNTKIGREYLRKFFYWFTVSDNAIALCAVDQTGNIMGYAIGAFNYGRALQKYLMPTTVLGILTHFWVLINPRFLRRAMMRLGLGQSSKRIAPLLPRLPRPTISLVVIGVSPECRGHGVGENLMQEFEKVSIANGLHSFRLSVYPNNMAARRLYEKVGWQPSVEPENPDEPMYYTKAIY